MCWKFSACDSCFLVPEPCAVVDFVDKLFSCNEILFNALSEALEAFVDAVTDVEGFTQIIVEFFVGAGDDVLDMVLGLAGGERNFIGRNTKAII